MEEIKNIVKFTKEDRSTFPYWHAHWHAFNMTAENLGCWRFKYLFHDFEKPWFRLFMSYKSVQKWHREHSDHHMIYYLIHGKWDPIAAIIDWECSRFTKQASPRNAAMQYKLEFDELKEFVMTANPDIDNNTVKYILAHPKMMDNFSETAMAIFIMYNDLHFAMNKLGIEHEYDPNYLRGYLTIINKK